jgi:hypothetical protein
LGAKLSLKVGSEILGVEGTVGRNRISLERVGEELQRGR